MSNIIIGLGIGATCLAIVFIVWYCFYSSTSSVEKYESSSTGPTGASTQPEVEEVIQLVPLDDNDPLVLVEIKKQFGNLMQSFPEFEQPPECVFQNCQFARKYLTCQMQPNKKYSNKLIIALFVSMIEIAVVKGRKPQLLTYNTTDNTVTFLTHSSMAPAGTVMTVEFLINKVIHNPKAPKCPDTKYCELV